MGIDSSQIRNELTIIKTDITNVISPTVNALMPYTNKMGALKQRISKLDSNNSDVIFLKQRYSELVVEIQKKASNVPKPADRTARAKKIKEQKIAELSRQINRLKLETLPGEHVAVAPPIQKRPTTSQEEVLQRFSGRLDDIDRKLQVVEQASGQYFVANELQELKDRATRKNEDYQYLRDHGEKRGEM